MKKRILSIVLVIALSIPLLSGMNTVVNAKVTKSSHASLPFEDINKEAWYIEGITFCYINEIVNGVNSYTYEPDNSVTRAQFVKMLATLNGVNLKEYESTESSFTDVKIGQWFHSAVTWASSKGYVNGIGGDLFAPDQKITREQLAKLMYVYAEKNGIDVSEKDDLSKFTDADCIGPWAYEYMKWAVGSGLINGVGTDTIAPAASATRAQAARIMMLFIRNMVYGECEHSFSEKTCTEAAICSNCGLKEGLALGHDCELLSCVSGSECLRCGEQVDSDSNIHNFAEAKCTRPRTCTDCGATRGAALGHSFSEVTCNEGSVCIRCGKFGTPAPGHTTYNGICERCGEEHFGNKNNRVRYYVKEKGYYDNGQYIYTDDNMTAVIYDANTGEIFFYSKLYSGSYYSIITINVTTTGDGEYPYEYLYYGDDDVTFKSKGNIKLKNGYISSQSYVGPKEYRSTYRDFIFALLDYHMYALDETLSSLCGYTSYNFNLDHEWFK